MGVRERLFNVVWEAAAGGTSFWGGGTGQAGTSSFSGQGLCRCENFRLQGCRVPLLSYPKAVYSRDRVIFEPMSNYFFFSLCGIPPFSIHLFVLSLGFVSCMRWCQARIGDESFVSLVISKQQYDRAKVTASQHLLDSQSSIVRLQMKSPPGSPT